MSLFASTMFSAGRTPKKALPVALFRCYLQSAMKTTIDLGLLQAGAEAMEVKAPDPQDRFQKSSGQNIFRVRASGKPGRAAGAAEKTWGMCPARRVV
jgi:hypothetical protein